MKLLWDSHPVLGTTVFLALCFLIGLLIGALPT